MCEEVGEDAVVGCEWEGRRGGDGGRAAARVKRACTYHA